MACLGHGDCDGSRRAGLAVIGGNRSRELLGGSIRQALLLDPVVNSITEAEKLLDRMLVLQADFLPEFR